MARKKITRNRYDDALKTNEHYDQHKKLFRFRYKDSRGKWQDTYAKNLERLRQKEEKILRYQGRGIDFKKVEQITLNNVFDVAIKQYDGNDKTICAYESLYGRHVRGGLGCKKIAHITDADVEDLYRYLLRSPERGGLGMALSTVCTTLNAALAYTFKYAIQHHLIAESPINSIWLGKVRKDFKSSKTERKPVDEEQLKHLLSYLKNEETYGPQLFIYLSFVIATGCRITEILGLRWPDVDFDKGYLHIAHTLSRNPKKRKLEYGGLKKDAHERDIPMIPQLAEVLQAEYDRQLRAGEKSEEIEGFTDFVISGRVLGKTQQDISKKIAYMIEKYNAFERIRAVEEGREPVLVDKFTSHCLRHNFAGLLVANTDVKTAQELLGHCNSQTTLDIYARSKTGLKQAAMAKVSEQFIF